MPVDYLHLPCPLYPYGGVQFLGSAASRGWPRRRREPARLTRRCCSGRLQGSHSKLSDTILDLGVHMCISQRPSRRHFMRLTVQTLTVSHEDLNHELGQRGHPRGSAAASPRAPPPAPRRVVAAVLRIAFSRAEARCFLSPDARDPVGGLPQGPAGPLGTYAFPPPRRVSAFCRYSNAFSRVVGSVSSGLFASPPVYNGKGF